MLGLSYGQVFLLLGATAALIGPKELPIIARTAGRLAGRAIGYIQLTRGQFDSILQETQARQVHKELQDTMAQLDAIRHELRSISLLNPGPLTTRLVDNIASQPPITNDKETSKPPKESTVEIESKETPNLAKTMDHSSATSHQSNIHSQATEYARLAESMPLASQSMDAVLNELKDVSGQFFVLPISAESAKLLPGQKDDLRGSDILLEAILEEGVANKARDFFSQASNE